MPLERIFWLMTSAQYSAWSGVYTNAYTTPKRKMNVIVACAPLTFVFPATPNLDESAATMESRHASTNEPMYSRGRRFILSVSSAPLNAPNAERMLLAKL